MNRKQGYVIIDMAMHVREKHREFLQMVTYQLTLLIILVQHTFLRDILHILLSDGQWTVSVVNMEQHLTCELKLCSIIDQLLNTKGNAELCLIGNLSQGLKHL